MYDRLLCFNDNLCMPLSFAASHMLHYVCWKKSVIWIRITSNYLVKNMLDRCVTECYVREYTSYYDFPIQYVCHLYNRFIMTGSAYVIANLFMKSYA